MKFNFANLNFRNLITVLLIVVLVVYWGVWNAFFQQDEWSGLGKYYSLASLNLDSKLIAYYQPLFKSGIAHFLPFLPIVNLLRYSIFGLNYEPYAIFSLLLHVFSSLSVFWLIKTWSKDNLSGLIGSILFAILPNASQAVTWVGTSLPTQFSFIFSTLAVIFWLKWLSLNSKKLLLTSIVFGILAIGFKETSLFLFVFLPFLHFLVRKSISKKVILNFLFLVVFYALLRLLVAFVGNTTTESFTTLYSLIKNAAINYVTVVPRGLFQIFIPQEIVYSLFKNVSLFVDEKLNLTLFSDPVFLEYFLIRPTLYIVGFALLIILLLKKKYFYLGYILTSLIPIVFITQGELNGLFLPSRGLYIPLVGAVGVLGEFGSKAIKEKKYIYLLFIILYILVSIIILKQQNSKLVEEGSQRKEILNTIKNQNPIIDDKQIMFLESDSSYYGLPVDTKILPFQSGLGKTLLVWYSSNEVFPKEFFENDFLWDIKSQGYQEFYGRGFGYFRDKNLLFETLKKHNIASESVIGYKWYSVENRLQNVTLELRREIEINEKNIK